MVYILARKASNNVNMKSPANLKVQAECIIYYWATWLSGKSCVSHAADLGSDLDKGETTTTQIDCFSTLVYFNNRCAG